jgi:rhomboid protease GluP
MHGEKTEESFAAYLAKALIARKGYHRGAVPEAQELFAHCDTVLTRGDGLTLSIVAILDREANPSREFSLTKEALEKLGADCLRYTGSTGRRKIPVHLSVVEIGSAPVTEEGKKRLEALKSSSLFAKVQIAAYAVNTSVKEVWTNAPVRGRGMRSFLKRAITGPRLTDAELTPKSPAAMPERRPLILTYGMLAGLLAIFVCEYAFRVNPPSGLLDPSINTLIALGALGKSLVLDDGQWWRLFSAPLLHGGSLHIAMNGIALFFAGVVLENVIGRAWFAAVFAVSAVTGGAMSLLINPDSLVSVGASGAIMGLFAAAFAVSYRYPAHSAMRTFLLSGSLRVLIPSMIPLFGGLAGETIDYAAHFGGALGGAAIGAILAALWPRRDRLPPYRKIALALAAAGLLGVLYSGIQVAKDYNAEELGLASNLIPAQQIPDDVAAAKAKSEEFVRAYPRDPRSHMYRALSLMGAGDSQGAEREWEAALGEQKMLHAFFKPELEDFLRANLAASMKENGREAEARQTAKPLCVTKGKFLGELVRDGLCP